MIRLLIVDDHAIVRSGLERLFSTAPGIELVGMAANGIEAVDLVGRSEPDVVLMDLSMPRMDGVEATGRLKADHPDVKILVLTSFGDESRVIEALHAGADGYVLKHIDPDDLLAAVEAVHGGGSPLDPQVGRVLLDASRARNQAPELTEREREVLELVRLGLANKQIARRLAISERTVKAHLTSIFQRLGVTDRTQAALWAQEHLR